MVTTAVDKWPAYAKLSAVAHGRPLTHSSYTTTGDTTAAQRCMDVVREDKSLRPDCDSEGEVR